MRLGELKELLAPCQARGEWPGGEIAGLAYDSRLVEPGVVFFALRGQAADGHRFLAQAQAAGALAAVVQTPAALDLPQLVVADSRRALALAAHQFHRQPSLRLRLVGVTGTNGKTTLAYLSRSLLEQEGPAGLISTILTAWPGESLPSALTTPESLDLAGLLARMAAAGARGAALEASSHALCQHRVTGTLLDVGVFTNLSRDHLDFHGDMDTYYAAKCLLFSQILPASRAAGKDPRAVICLDDPRGAELAVLGRDQGLTVLTYGFHPAAQVRGREPVSTLDGGSCLVSFPGGEMTLATSLVGGYNLQNLLGGAAVGLALGLSPEKITRGLAGVSRVPGRLERVGRGLPAVFVDYAHTDQALAGVLASLRPLTRGRLLCVFGAGGDRDQGKRPLMGLAVGRGADLAVLTSDNPRTEEPGAILDMIEPGLAEAGFSPAGAEPADKTYLREPDRARAIHRAVTLARPGDVVVIAGKGHEDYQIVGREKRHFDDREVAAAALAARPAGEEGAHAAS
ncbi:MAG: UDP-N-acetylmuramoyl-L-alanyl-D-glutamate--2,6-diaminopimelate ligase [Deltaproteobacteria bacterium]|nr:UDP-N-acetylmuramoyl-L-alanyl-D-glutamate--2,6-diaminopimelate ligase [Deltaproteobacteria bacterium]